MTEMALSFLSLKEASRAAIDWPDVYFAPAYGGAEQASLDAPWEVAVWQPGPIIYPYLRRSIDVQLAGRAGCFDIVSPYGYAGTWGPAEVSTESWAQFRAAFRGAMRDRGCVAEFMRLSSLVPGADALLGSDSALQSTQHNDTVLVSLQAGYDAYWTAAAKRSRTAVRKARKLGYQLTVRAATAADLSSGGAFRRVYEETMRRVEASPRYFFDGSYYDCLLDGLGERLHLAEVRSAAGDVVAAGLFMQWGQLLHYHLSGSQREAARAGVNNMMIDGVIRHAVEVLDVTRLHLGGGVKAEDSLFKFKLGFGGERLPFRVAHSVLDDDAYRTLVAARARARGTTEVELIESGFFPAYRAA